MAKAIGSLDIPAGSIQNTDIAAGAQVSASKLEHQHNVMYSQADGTDVVSATVPIWLATNSGTIEEVTVRPLTAPTSADNYTVDIQKAAAASGTYTTILSAVVTVDSSSVDETEQSGTLSTSSYSDGDCFQVVVTATASGNEGQGMIVILKLREQA